MASKLSELLLAALAPVLQSVATAKLGELFTKLHEHDEEGHSATLRSMYIGVGQLQRLTDESKTKLDDAIVDALKEAIEESAEEFDVELPAA